MAQFLLSHRHEPDQCGAVAVAWRGFRSPLRGTTTVATCRFGGHEVWWEVEAPDAAAALALLPPYVAALTCVVRVGPLEVP